MTSYHQKSRVLPGYASEVRVFGYQSKTAPRHHLVARLSQLENEQKRLQREAEMWGRRKQRAEEKLLKNYRQISSLKKKIGLKQSQRPMTCGKSFHGYSRSEIEESQARTRPVTSISFEY